MTCDLEIQDWNLKTGTGLMLYIRTIVLSQGELNSLKKMRLSIYVKRIYMLKEYSYKLKNPYSINLSIYLSILKEFTC